MALDEVHLLTIVADKRTRLLDAIPPGSSTAAATTNTAAAAASVGGEREGGAGVSGAVKAAENEAAAAAAAAAGAECIVRYFGHFIHKGLRGSMHAKVLYIVILSRKCTRKFTRTLIF